MLNCVAQLSYNTDPFTFDTILSQVSPFQLVTLFFFSASTEKPCGFVVFLFLLPHTVQLTLENLVWV